MPPGHLLKEKLAKLAIDHRVEAGALKQLKVTVKVAYVAVCELSMANRNLLLLTYTYQNGEDVMLSDGRRVRAADVVSAHTPGRKVSQIGERTASKH